MTNTAKLKGKIVECGYSLTTFSEKMNLSRPCLRKKINGETDFKASEIEKACSILDIPANKLEEYFFYKSCPHNGNN